MEFIHHKCHVLFDQLNYRIPDHSKAIPLLCYQSYSHVAASCIAIYIPCSLKALQHLKPHSGLAVTGQNLNQGKIFQPRLIIHFFCLLALIINDLGLGDKRN